MPISVELIDTAQLTWSNALEEAPESAVSAVVTVEPTGGRMLVCAELALLLTLIERLLGGGAGERPAPRHLTDVDLALVRRILQTLLDELSISFADLAEDLRFGLNELETERAPTGLAPLSEPTLAMTLEAKVGRTSSTLVVIIPHRAIEPVLAAAAEGDVRDGETDSAGAVGEALGSVTVELRAEVGSTELALDDVLALRPGDVVRLDRGAGQGMVTLFADAVALHQARLGRNGRRRAVQIQQPAEEAP
jgi:flagellar motor switch protein FliM